MYDRIPQEIKDKWGTGTQYTLKHPENFLQHRIDARCKNLGEAGLLRLEEAPKMRESPLGPDGERYIGRRANPLKLNLDKARRNEQDRAPIKNESEDGGDGLSRPIEEETAHPEGGGALPHPQTPVPTIAVGTNDGLLLDIVDDSDEIDVRTSTLSAEQDCFFVDNAMPEEPDLLQYSSEADSDQGRGYSGPPSPAQQLVWSEWLHEEYC
jgi:hypothetical protein